MTGNVRPIENIRPEVGDTLATEQPGSIATLTDDPTYDELPVDETNTPVILHYYNVSTDQIKYAIPHSGGSVHYAIDVDLSGTVDRTTDTVTGLL